jgi:gliding motility-associated-like protein
LVPYSYLWSNGQSGASVTSLAPGVYSVTVTDQNGCDTSGAITVGHVVATLNISSVIKNESCGHSNGSVALNVSGGTTPYAYAWNTGSVLQNSSNLAAGNYYVNVTDANGCAATDTFLLTNVVAISFQSSSTPDHCSNHVGSININPTDGTAPFTYSWSTGAGTQGVAALGAGTYTVTVTDSLGCSSTGTITVDNIDETFNGSISGNNHIDQDEATVLTANIPNGWSFLYWIDDHGDTIKTKNMSLIYPYPDYGTYNMTLYVESASGCLLDIPYSVAVEPSWTFYVPNAMSPDGDGTNDLFFPKFTGVTEVKGWIYDRWGVNCFEFKESGDYWDGYYKGQRAPEDVYVYKFDFTDLKGKKHSINGTVSVIR